jgi:hypothetical protein
MVTQANINNLYWPLNGSGNRHEIRAASDAPLSGA